MTDYKKISEELHEKHSKTFEKLHMSEKNDKIAAHLAENERLRAALENAAGLLMWCADAKPGIDTQKGREVARAFAEQTRAALKETRT
jgi:hypothetical protein